MSRSATGGSCGGQFSRPSKRPFTPADQTAERIANRQPAGGDAARQPFDPFVTIPNQCYMDKSDVNKKWFVRGQSGEVLSSLMKEGKCVLCKQTRHPHGFMPHKTGHVQCQKVLLPPLWKEVGTCCRC
jgi:hypothetical protein